MAFPSGLFKIACIMQIDDHEPWVCTHGYLSLTPSPDRDAVAAQCARAWGTSGGPFAGMSDRVVGLEVQATDLNTPSSVGISDFGPASLKGGSESSPIVAPSVALIMSLKTSERGRAFRGRMYVPAITEAHVQADGARWGISDPFIIGLATNWLSSVEDGTHDTGTAMVVSRKHVLATPVSSVHIREQFGTQRRREKHWVA